MIIHGRCLKSCLVIDESTKFRGSFKEYRENQGNTHAAGLLVYTTPMNGKPVNCIEVLKSLVMMQCVSRIKGQFLYLKLSTKANQARSNFDPSRLLNKHLNHED